MLITAEIYFLLVRKNLKVEVKEKQSVKIIYILIAFHKNYVNKMHVNL